MVTTVSVSEEAKTPVRKQSIKIGRSDSSQSIVRQLSVLLSRPCELAHM